MRTGMVFALALLLQGCAAELVVSEYDFRPLSPSFSGLVSDLNSGARQLNNLGDVDCRFETNLATAAPTAQHIDLDINGTVGVPGSSAHLLAFNGEAVTCVPFLAGVQGNLIITLDLSTSRWLSARRCRSSLPRS